MEWDRWQSCLGARTLDTKLTAHNAPASYAMCSPAHQPSTLVAASSALRPSSARTPAASPAAAAKWSWVLPSASDARRL